MASPALSSTPSPSAKDRPRRNIIQKSLDYNNGLSWKEEKELKKALQASLHELTPKKTPSKHSVAEKNETTPKKEMTVVPPARSAEVAAKVADCMAKVHAQRKFAQGMGPSSSGRSSPATTPTTTPSKCRSKTATPSGRCKYRPSTEDFLTFLCLRGTSDIPPELERFNYVSCTSFAEDAKTKSTNSAEVKNLCDDLGVAPLQSKLERQSSFSEHIGVDLSKLWPVPRQNGAAGKPTVTVKRLIIRQDAEKSKRKPGRPPGSLNVKPDKLKANSKSKQARKIVNKIINRASRKIEKVITPVKSKPCEKIIRPASIAAVSRKVEGRITRSRMMLLASSSTKALASSDDVKCPTRGRPPLRRQNHPLKVLPSRQARPSTSSEIRQQIVKKPTESKQMMPVKRCKFIKTRSMTRRLGLDLSSSPHKNRLLKWAAAPLAAPISVMLEERAVKTRHRRQLDQSRQNSNDATVSSSADRSPRKFAEDFLPPSPKRRRLKTRSKTRSSPRLEIQSQCVSSSSSVHSPRMRADPPGMSRESPVPYVKHRNGIKQDLSTMYYISDAEDTKLKENCLKHKLDLDATKEAINVMLHMQSGKGNLNVATERKRKSVKCSVATQTNGNSTNKAQPKEGRAEEALMIQMQAKLPKSDLQSTPTSDKINMPKPETNSTVTTLPTKANSEPTAPFSLRKVDELRQLKSISSSQSLRKRGWEKLNGGFKSFQDSFHNYAKKYCDTVKPAKRLRNEPAIANSELKKPPLTKKGDPKTDNNKVVPTVFIPASATISVKSELTLQPEQSVGNATALNAQVLKVKTEGDLPSASASKTTCANSSTPESPTAKRGRGRPPGPGSLRKLNTTKDSLDAPQRRSKESIPAVNVGKLIKAPTFRPTNDDFKDPLAYIESIRSLAEPYGMCVIVPPDDWKPECKVSDDMRISTQIQYLQRMYRRFGPSDLKLECIKCQVESEGVTFAQPLVGGIELDLPKFYDAVRRCGGMQDVIQKKKWVKISDFLGITKFCHDKVPKLYDAYCKYLVSYDALSTGDKGALEKKVKSEQEKNKNANDLRPFIRGSSMTLHSFFRIARNTMNMYYKKEKEVSVSEIEADYWKILRESSQHVVVQSGSALGSAFPSGKDSPFSRHGWNLNVLGHSHASVLRPIAVPGITVPHVDVGMLFSTRCWSRDQLLLSSVQYIHTGSKRIFYTIPQTHCKTFEELMHKTFLEEHQGVDAVFDTCMVPPSVLTSNRVSVCRAVAEPGQFVVTFPHSYSASVCCGYSVAEKVCFARADWLPCGHAAIKQLQQKCRAPSMSFQQLVLQLALDSRTSLEALEYVHPILSEMYENEINYRRQLFALGLKGSERLSLPGDVNSEGKQSKSSRKLALEEEQHHCNICRCIPYVSLVLNEQEQNYLCLEHAVPYISKRKNLKSCRLFHRYDAVELADIIERLKQRIELKKKSPRKRSTCTSPVDTRATFAAS